MLYAPLIERQLEHLPTSYPLSLEFLRHILFENKILPLARSADVTTKLIEALSIPQVREILEWEVPLVTDVGELCRFKMSGRVRAIRMDQYIGAENMKKPVVAGLILKDVILGKIPKKRVTSLADAGSINTGISLQYYCEKLSLSGFYIMSRHFPADMVALVQSPCFTVVQAPANNAVGREREYYGHLVKMMAVSNFRKDKHCLWHAKYGGNVLYPAGRELAKELKEVPDYLVVSVGSGSTLEYMTVIQDYFCKRRKPKIVVVEHVLSSLFTNSHPTTIPSGVPNVIEEDTCLNNFTPSFFRKPAHNEIPYSILGPHYDERSPFITESTLEKIDYVQQYTDEEWMKMSHVLQSHGLSVGNSSAANTFVATVLATKGYDVLTVALEPLRSYYKASSKPPYSPRFLGQVT